MKLLASSWFKRTILSIGLSGMAGSFVAAQEDASKLTQPVLRISKNEVVAPPPAAPHPLDPAINLAHQSLGMIQRDLADYTGVLVKRERIGNSLGEHEFMFVKIRNRKTDSNNQLTVPFSVYLAFLKPAAVKGREVIFVENQNSGNLIAHEGGMKRMLGTHSLQPTGMLAMAGQRYPLTDIGIENLVFKLIERGEKDKKYGTCNVDLIPGAKVSKRDCTIIQVVHPVQQPHFDFHVAQIFMDDQLKIPVRYAAFDWPAKAGDSTGEVIEEYTYQDLKFNVGLTDADFDPNNKDYNFHKK
jgi:hypothetical protein